MSPAKIANCSRIQTAVTKHAELSVRVRVARGGGGGGGGERREKKEEKKTKNKQTKKLRRSVMVHVARVHVARTKKTYDVQSGCLWPGQKEEEKKEKKKKKDPQYHVQSGWLGQNTSREYSVIMHTRKHTGCPTRMYMTGTT